MHLLTRSFNYLMTDSNCQEPIFPKIVHITTDSDQVKSLLDTLKASLTDEGLCYTMNAKSVGSTFNVTNDKRLRSFANILDGKGTDVEPIKVKGSGYLYRSMFWINVRGYTEKSWYSKQGATAAINNWDDYFSARL